MPAHRKVDFAKAQELLHGEVTLAAEERIAELFPDCEVGAEPPFGNLYNLPVYVSPELTRDEFITFNAGTHHEAIKMRYADFERLVKPEELDLTWHD
jgi:Ala-tRNA(Pro) deacylase